MSHHPVRDRTEESLRVRIIAANEETLDGLQAYLRQAGVDAHGTRQLGTDKGGDRGPSAVILFPDDFPTSDVLREVDRLRRTHPQPLIVVVTREPRRFSDVLDVEEGARPPVLVPKPVWGWVILDAIHGRLEPE
jgi:hypothetical protein